MKNFDYNMPTINFDFWIELPLPPKKDCLPLPGNTNPQPAPAPAPAPAQPQPAQPETPPATQGTVAPEPVKPTLTPELKNALEKVLEAKTGKKVKVDEKTKVNEQDLYAAAAYQKMNASQKKEFIKELKKEVKQEKKDGTDFHKAIDDAMRNMIKNKKLTKDEFSAIKQEALGKAQLDDDTSWLGTRSRQLGDGSKDSALEKFSNNGAATDKDAKVFRNRQAEIEHALQRQKAASKSKGGSNASSGASSSGSSSSSVGAGGPGGFVWKPVSESDGKLAIILPTEITGQVASVKVVDSKTGKVTNGAFKGVANGGREHFRFPQAGGNFSDRSQVVITMKDGSTKTISISETSARKEQRSV